MSEMKLEMTLSPAQVATRPPLWLVLHWAQQTDNTREYGRPEVEPMFPAHYSPFGQPWQLSVMARHPKFAPKKIVSIYDWQTWMTNEQGYGKPNDPRANWFTGENLNPLKPLPKVENLLGGGTVCTGYVDGMNLVVETLDWRMTPPSPEWFADHPWFTVPALTVDANGIPRMFKQGIQPDGSVELFRHPMICDRVRFPKITIPLSKVRRWTAPELPDPLRLYPL